MTGGAASSRKGSAYERELVNRFLDAGWGCLRLGASGGGGDADLPDVFAGKPVPVPGRGRFTDALAVELKSGKATTLYADGSEVDDLLAFAEAWGAQAYLGARFTTQASPTMTFLVGLESARRTDSGRYGLPVATIEERASVVVGEGGVKRT